MEKGIGRESHRRPGVALGIFACKYPTGDKGTISFDVELTNIDVPEQMAQPERNPLIGAVGNRPFR